MSIMPSQQLQGRHLIAQYIVERRQKGSFLRYSEYELIDQWLELGDESTVLLTLEDLLNKLYSRPGREQASMSLIHKKVCERLKSQKQRTVGKALEK